MITYLVCTGGYGHVPRTVHASYRDEGGAQAKARAILRREGREGSARPHNVHILVRFE